MCEKIGDLAESDEVEEHLSDELAKESLGFAVFLDRENLGDDGLDGGLAVLQHFVG